MPKVGKYDYPNLDPSDAIEIGKELVNTFNGEPSNVDNFAQAIGHSTSNSGAYMGKVADMRKYGLIESRGVQATSLARKLANPKDEQERKEAYFQMFKNVDLLQKIYEELDGEESHGDMWVIISEITGAERKEAREVEDKISKLYKKMIQYSDVESSRGKSGREGSGGGRKGDGGVYVQVGEDDMNLSEENVSSIDLAINFLEQKKNEIESED